MEHKERIERINRLDRLSEKAGQRSSRRTRLKIENYGNPELEELCEESRQLWQKLDSLRDDLLREVEIQRQREILGGKTILLVESVSVLNNEARMVERELGIDIFGADRALPNMSEFMKKHKIEGAIVHLASESDVQPIIQAHEDGHVVIVLTGRDREEWNRLIRDAGIWTLSKSVRGNLLDGAFSLLVKQMKKRAKT